MGEEEEGEVTEEVEEEEDGENTKPGVLKLEDPMPSICSSRFGDIGQCATSTRFRRFLNNFVFDLVEFLLLLPIVVLLLLDPPDPL